MLIFTITPSQLYDNRIINNVLNNITLKSMVLLKISTYGLTSCLSSDFIYLVMNHVPSDVEEAFLPTFQLEFN